jgi:branched-subunit amino acid aminotransferase/4-amino-4-deoxychorismate lyase
VPSRDAFDELVTEALGAVAEKDVALRLYWTPGPPGGPAMGIALVSHIPGWIEELRATGQRLASLSLPRRQADWLLPGTKSTSYAVHIAAEAEAKRRGADDALFVDAGDVVLEGPVTNVWWREDDTLLTPSLDLGILAGETRAALLELAPGEGYRIEEGAFALSRLLDADEVFTSSSVREVLPAAKVDDTVFELGPAARRLQTALRRAATR